MDGFFELGLQDTRLELVGMHRHTAADLPSRSSENTEGTVQMQIMASWTSGEAS